VPRARRSRESSPLAQIVGGGFDEVVNGGVVRKVFEQDAVGPEAVLQTASVADAAQPADERKPIEARQDAADEGSELR
jgi:hypothetical protein